MTLTFQPPIIVITLFIARIIEMASRRTKTAGRVVNPATWLALLISGSTTISFALCEYFFRCTGGQVGFVALGFLVGISSFGLRAWAARALGNYWSMQIEVWPDQKLMKSGPYAWIRHPIYAAAALELLGAIITLQAWWSILVFTITFAPALRWRIKSEEVVLLVKFGQEYREYMKVTPALFAFRRSQT